MSLISNGLFEFSEAFDLSVTVDFLFINGRSLELLASSGLAKTSTDGSSGGSMKGSMDGLSNALSAGLDTWPLLGRPVNQNANWLINRYTAARSISGFCSSRLRNTAPSQSAQDRKSVV